MRCVAPCVPLCLSRDWVSVLDLQRCQAFRGLGNDLYVIAGCALRRTCHRILYLIWFIDDGIRQVGAERAICLDSVSWLHFRDST